MKLVYVVCADKLEADRIGRALVTQRLAACVNIWPISSYYSWHGKFRHDRETVLLVKTSARQLKRAVAFITRQHSYAAPAILAFDTRSHNRHYSEWFHGILSKKATA